jgi:8-oxo-dGTP pyrophosphatase MutT (NUDIX family)
MFSTLPPEVQDELAQLQQRYGETLVRMVDLASNGQFDPLNRTDRYGEVCMVVRRPNGRLLTMIKTIYPRGAFRLPTGGINHGEGVLEALLRETQEETGLQVIVSRFLTAIAYCITGHELPVFYTFAFLLDEVGSTLGAIDEDERVEAFREIEPAELPALGQYLAQLRVESTTEGDGDWHDWGQFRAVVHNAVYDALNM